MVGAPQLLDLGLLLVEHLLERRNGGLRVRGREQDGWWVSGVSVCWIGFGRGEKWSAERRHFVVRI